MTLTWKINRFFPFQKPVKRLALAAAQNECIKLHHDNQLVTCEHDNVSNLNYTGNHKWLNDN